MTTNDPRRASSDPDAIKDNDLRDRRLSDPDEDVRELDESAFRDRADWIESIGPEDEDPEVILDQLEDYGWDELDDVVEMSLPSAHPAEWWKSDSGDDPDVVGDELYSTLIDANDNLSLRPVEDQVMDDLGEVDLTDDDDPEDDLNFPQPRDI